MIKKVNVTDDQQLINRSEFVWLMHQIISIYFDNNHDLALKLNLVYKPLTTFMIVFDLMVDSDDSDKTEYLTLVHDYLARFENFNLDLTIGFYLNLTRLIIRFFGKNNESNR